MKLRRQTVFYHGFPGHATRQRALSSYHLLQSDKAFADEFKANLSGADAKVKEGTRQVGKRLDEMIIKQFKAMEIINKSAK